MNFEEVYELVDQNSHETAFSREEAKLFYDTLLKLPHNASVVEIGVEWGRSTTVIGLVGKEKRFRFAAIDHWLGNQGFAQHLHVKNFHKANGINSLLLRLSSKLANWEIRERYSDLLPIDLLHIDGNHSPHGIIVDCTVWLPELKEGGLVCFHDYGRDSLPNVKITVDEMLTDPLSRLPLYELVDKAHTFAVFRKQ